MPGVFLRKKTMKLRYAAIAYTIIGITIGIAVTTDNKALAGAGLGLGLAAMIIDFLVFMNKK